MNVKTIFSGAFILFVGNLLSSVLGMGREIMSAAYYGADVDMDSYLFANTIPSLFLAFIGGLFTAGFIPLFIKKRVEQSPEAASRMYSNTMNWLILTVIAVTVLCYFFSDGLASIFASNKASQNQIKELLWILLPSILFFGVSFAQTAVLNSLHHFKTPAFLSVLNNVVVIAFIVLLHKQWGVASIAVGYVLGTVLQVVIQLPVMSKLGIRYRWHLSLKEDYLKKLFVMSLPIIGLVIIDQCIMLATRFFSAYLDAGSASSLNYAHRIIMLPVTLFGTTLVSAMYPSIVQLIAEKKNREYNAVVATCVKSMVLILAPIMMTCMLFSKEIIRILLERGAFDDTATDMTSASFMILSAGIVLMPIRDFFTKLFYSKENMKAPTLSSFFYLLTFVGGCFILVPQIGYVGIASSNLVAMFVAFFYNMVLHRRMNREYGSGFSAFYFVKVFGSAVIAATLAYLFFAGCMTVNELQPYRSIISLISMGLGLLLYLGIVKMLKIEEISIVFDKMGAKFKIGKRGKELKGVQDA